MILLKKSKNLKNVRKKPYGPSKKKSKKIEKRYQKALRFF